MAPTKIGYYDKGAFSARQDVLAEATSIQGVSYDRAVGAARTTAGADLIVARAGETFTYDVYSLSIKKGQIPVAGAGQYLHLEANVPATLNASEAVLFDENNTAQVLLAPGATSDPSRGRSAIGHARKRDIDGALAVTASITHAATRTTLTSSLRGLKPVLAEVESREAGLRNDLAQAEQALATKRAPFDRALAAANGEHSRTASQHRTIVSDKSEALREARKPGIHQAESDVAARQGDLEAARRELGNAQQRLSAAQSTIAHADQLRAELDGIPYQVATVRRKLDDYADARREYDYAYRRYQEALRRYEAELREWEQSGSHQNPPSDPVYQNGPSDPVYQNGGSDPVYQNRPSNPTYQNRPSDPVYQNRGPRPIRPTEPSLRTPSSWNWGDTEYGLRAELSRLESRSYTLRSEEARVRSEGYRQQSSAQEAIRSAESSVGRAESRLDAATTHLQTLPDGDAASISRAEKALETARSNETSALRPLQAKIEQARTALDTNTQAERTRVSQVQGDLRSAPQVFLRAVDAAETAMNQAAATAAPAPTTPSSSGGGYTPSAPTKAKRNSP